MRHTNSLSSFVHVAFFPPVHFDRDSVLWGAVCKGNFLLSTITILFAIRIPDVDRERTSLVRFTLLDSAHLLRGQAGQEPHLAMFR